MNHRSYLEAMGITLWRLRDEPAPAPAVTAVVPRPAAAVQPPEPTVVAIPSAAEAVPVPPPVAEAETPAPVAATDSPAPSVPTRDDEEPDFSQLPVEYAQWASLTEEFGDDLEPPPSPEEQRATRIAGLDWEALRAEVEGCTACALHTSRNRPVFGVGNRQADWMIIGEAPGAEEDRQGEPFVGKAGRLLDAMLRAVTLDRQQVFIANVLKSRPPNNRDPLPEEAAACWPFLARQIDLVRPVIILAVGRIAAQLLLGTDTPVGRLRGRVHRLEQGRIPVVVTYHPAYLLRAPREKRKAWEDLQLARQTLAEAQARHRPS